MHTKPSQDILVIRLPWHEPERLVIRGRPLGHRACRIFRDQSLPRHGSSVRLLLDICRLFPRCETMGDRHIVPQKIRSDAQRTLELSISISRPPAGWQPSLGRIWSGLSPHSVQSASMTTPEVMPGVFVFQSCVAQAHSNY